MTQNKTYIKDLGQFFTPVWAGELLYDAHFSYLGPTDLIWEPTCGSGSLLSAIPSHIPCIGSEIDLNLAIRAKEATGREILVGDCLSVDIQKYGRITAVFGNPPFKFTLFDKLLQRCANILQIGQKAGFIIPAYFLQTSRTVMDIGRRWHISQEILPRDVFPGLSKPLIFGTFIRENSPMLIGFRLFSETVSMKEITEKMKEELSYKIKGSRSVWKNAVAKILLELGGTADLNTIYKHMSNKRPTENSFWKEQVRKVCQQNFNRVAEGTYKLEYH